MNVDLSEVRRLPLQTTRKVVDFSRIPTKKGGRRGSLATAFVGATPAWGCLDIQNGCVMIPL